MHNKSQICDDFPRRMFEETSSSSIHNELHPIKLAFKLMMVHVWFNLKFIGDNHPARHNAMLNMWKNVM